MALFLLARLGAELVALPADRINSVVELGHVVPVPRVAPHVAGLCAIRSRVVTVVDVHAALALAAPDPVPATAALCDVDGHAYALLFDAVEDIVDAAPPGPCSAAVDPRWARAALGIVEVAGASVLLLDPGRLVEAPGAVAAAA